MKIYALISIIIFCGVSCHSSSNTIDTSEQTETKKEAETKIERQNSLLVGSKKTELNTQIDEDITLITYDPLSGNIQSIQKTNKSTNKKNRLIA